MEDLKISHKGEVVFWTGRYGFVRKEGSTESLFFHKTDLDTAYRNVSVLDKVNFAIKKTEFGRHAGKLDATQIYFVERGKFSDYERTIGMMEDWNGDFGYLRSFELDKPVLIHKNRLLKNNKDKGISSGEYFTFSPVISSKDPDQLFAFFAYPIHKERDVDFLREKRQNTSIPIIRETISKAIWNMADKTADFRFELELEDIMVNEKYPLEALKGLIKRCRMICSPSLDLLKKHLPDEYLIQLWESRIIKEYDLDTATRYFHHSPADTKRVIISFFTREDRPTVLRSHLNMLLDQGRFTGQSNAAKCFLDIVQRNETTRNPEIYAGVREYIYRNFPEREQVELWLKDYIDVLPNSILEKNLDLLDLSRLSVHSHKKDLILELLEKYVLEFKHKHVFEGHFPTLIKHILSIKNHFPDQLDEILKRALPMFDSGQLLFLWMAEPSIPFGVAGDFDHHADDLPINSLLKFLLNIDSKPAGGLIEKINEENLFGFVGQFDWTANEEIENPTSFISNVMAFNEKFGKNIVIETLAEAIYDKIELYTVHHLRLWINDLVKEDRFSYVGYREKFKDLTFQEQKIFKDKGERLLIENIIEGESFEVEACLNFIQADDTTTIYRASARNIYFLNGRLQLRRENNKYTHAFKQSSSRTAFNRIGSRNPLNELEFTVTVENDEIQAISGLDIFFSELRTAGVIKALGIPTGVQSDINSNQNAYVEDYELRKIILDFLDRCQYGNRPIPLGEPKSRYVINKERNTQNVDPYEIAQLFTIQTSDGLGIIWENVDYSKDRATYIFKTTEENYPLQLKKLTQIIISSWHLRSTLSSTKSDGKLQIFKNDLGYITKILKQRGNTGAFKNWKGKLNMALKESIPDIPLQSQVDSLKGWLAEMPVRSPGTKLDPTTFTKMNPDPGETVYTRDEILVPLPKIESFKKQEILRRIKEINDMFEIKSYAGS